MFRFLVKNKRSSFQTTLLSPKEFVEQGQLPAADRKEHQDCEEGHDVDSRTEHLVRIDAFSLARRALPQLLAQASCQVLRGGAKQNRRRRRNR